VRGKPPLPELQKVFSRRVRGDPGHDPTGGFLVPKAIESVFQEVRSDPLSLEVGMDIECCELVAIGVLEGACSSSCDKAHRFSRGLSGFPDLDTARASAQPMVPELEATIEGGGERRILRIPGGHVEFCEGFGIGQLGLLDGKKRWEYDWSVHQEVLFLLVKLTLSTEHGAENPARNL
jgi:hypothetical protein